MGGRPLVGRKGELEEQGVVKTRASLCPIVEKAS
jgi:hypothetical protein